MPCYSLLLDIDVYELCCNDIQKYKRFFLSDKVEDFFKDEEDITSYDINPTKRITRNFLEKIKRVILNANRFYSFDSFRFAGEED